MTRAKKETTTKETPRRQGSAGQAVTKAKPARGKAVAKTSPAKDAVSVETSVQPKATKAAKSTLTIDVYDIKGNITESLSLPAKVFGVKVNAPLMAQAIRVFESNQHPRRASAKTRGEVTGSTRKIYRQKGSGRARHGAITAPTFVGGGKSHGPKPKDWRLAMPTKMRRSALFSALTDKLANDNVRVVAGLGTLEPKTKAMAKVIAALSNQTGKKPEHVLVVLPKSQDNVRRAARNIPYVDIDQAANLHTYEVVRAKKVLFMREAIETLEKTFVRK